MFFSSCHRASPEVVLYTSCDDYLLREVIPAFEKQTGIAVKIVGDTEATKTTGLVERLVAEKGRPRADVWWSNEPFGTVRLDHEGVLEPYTSAAEKDFAGGWPAWVRAKDRMWYGFALRARVVAYNEKRVKPDEVPRALEELLYPAWSGRIGMARPQFGTARGQLGALRIALGPAFADWVQGLKDNRVRLYDGNSSVVRALAQGEIDVGLTDSDDVAAGRHEGWPVRQVLAPLTGTTARPMWQSVLPIPNTVARVRGGPHAPEAAALIDFLLSERAERILARSDSHTTPIRPGLRAEAGEFALPILDEPHPDFEAIADAIPEALKIWNDAFGR